MNNFIDNKCNKYSVDIYRHPDEDEKQILKEKLEDCKYEQSIAHVSTKKLWFVYN